MALPKEVADAVVQDPDADSQYHGTWGFVCPRPSGCSQWSSLGWPTKADAAARLSQHLTEHDEGLAATREKRAFDRSLLTPELADFMADRGLTTHPETGLAVKA